jgi:hypothetical protein
MRVEPTDLEMDEDALRLQLLQEYLSDQLAAMTGELSVRSCTKALRKMSSQFISSCTFDSSARGNSYV